VELVFTFGPNEYFSNSVLKKIVELNEDDEPVKTTGTPIEWKEGKNTTVKITKKTQKNKKTGAKRVVEKESKIESFFNFFSDSAPLKDEEKEDEDEEN
jgi:nucleosome assembly protein 1-like 1